ncbi:hypothetical protein [Portibacter marinus]|uniref:hypothetical protein n=1 Tax=Portibacter marinus TaxID=2898660 RepID=UPI001F265B01|nr:hypothetical protein [Portibacter marinus]
MIYSKFISKRSSWNESSIFRHSFLASVDLHRKVYDFVDISLFLSYQERTPLEIIVYQQVNSTGNVTATVLSKWPTNPQNMLFENSLYGIPFPRFKYFHVHLIPMLKVGSRLKVKLGVGPFLGVLLNRKQTTVTKELFDPSIHSLFDGILSEDIMTFTKYDAGILPKVHISYGFTKKITFALQCSYYMSLRRLNDTFVNRKEFTSRNMKWRALYTGLAIGIPLIAL